MKIRFAIIIAFVAATMAAQMADAKKNPENKSKVEVETSSTTGWICTLSPFTNEYKATGGSKNEAKERTIKNCKEKENPMFCKDPECTKG